MQFEVRKHHYANHVNGPTDEVSIYFTHSSSDHGTPDVEACLDLSMDEASNLIRELLGLGVELAAPTA